MLKQGPVVEETGCVSKYVPPFEIGWQFERYTVSVGPQSAGQFSAVSLASQMPFPHTATGPMHPLKAMNAIVRMKIVFFKQITSFFVFNILKKMFMSHQKQC
jgi:hypothetical protein